MTVHVTRRFLFFFFFFLSFFLFSLWRPRKTEIEWTGKTDTRKTELLTVGEACIAIFWPFPGLQEENLWWLLLSSRRRTRLEGTLMWRLFDHPRLKHCSARRSCVEVEVAVLGSPSLISLVVSVDVNQHWIKPPWFCLGCDAELVTRGVWRGEGGMSWARSIISTCLRWLWCWR